MSFMRAGGRTRLGGSIFMKWLGMGDDVDVEMGIARWVGKSGIVAQGRVEFLFLLA